MPISDYPLWRRPRHHMDAETASDHVHWVELFYDLIHVVTIFMLGNYLSHHLDWHGFWVFSGLFLAVWYAWADNTVYNSLYVSTDIHHRLAMALQVVTVMIMAAAIPSIGDGGWPYFALAFAVNRAMTGRLYWRARAIGHESRNSMAFETTRNFMVLAVIFAVSAILPRPLAYWVFGTALAGVILQYVVPRIGTARFERFVPRLGHLSERFALLVLIMLGEGFFKLVVTLADKGIDKVGGGALFNLAIGGISIFVLVWVYFDAVGNAKPRDDRLSLIIYWFGHLVLMWGSVLVGVALAGEVYVGFLDPYPLGYGLLGGTGMIAFLASLWVIQQVITGRDTTRRFHHGRVRAFGIAMTLLMLAVFQYVPSIIGNLIWGTALFSQVAWPLWQAYRKFRADGAAQAGAVGVTGASGEG